MANNWERVAETVKRRRTALGLSQRAAADRAGVSPTTWGSLETHHQRVDDLSRPKFCHALGWTADSIDLVLAGDDPIENGTPPPLSDRERISAIEARVEELAALVEEIVRREP